MNLQEQINKMKNEGRIKLKTGMIRKIDDLGRVVIPKELRDFLGYEKGTDIEILTEGEKIILRKYTVGCNICGSTDHIITVDNISLCSECLNKFRGR